MSDYKKRVSRDDDAPPKLTFSITSRPVTVEVPFETCTIRLDEDEVKGIIERAIRSKYGLSLRCEVKVSLLDIERSEDAAEVTVEKQIPNGETGF